MKNSNKNKIIYLDYAATTPVDPRVLRAMLPYFSEKFGNTMSLHSVGRQARLALEKSREKIASIIGAESKEVIFTGSATESNNLALKGIAFANKNRGRHIIISPIEHPCIIESAKWLEKQGFKITKLKVDKYGLVDPRDVEKSITKDTILVSIIHASNEIGTIEPIEEIGRVIEKFNLKNPNSKIYFHTDAAQTFGKIPINVQKLKVDLLTASSHKIYGPKGAAILYIKEGTKIEPILHGGEQEMGIRSSTINVPAIVGFARAAEICQKEMDRESKRLSKLRDILIDGILKSVPNSFLNGHPQKRLPNNINFSFDFVEGESIAIQLDLLGICVSTGSACSSAKLEPSYVLLALGFAPQRAHSSLRLSLGRKTTRKDIDYVLKILPEIIKNLRKISPF
ncbi:MAG: cysteine desulfurase family protein [Candidatus Pacebacteria bacterium]|nr:cysteine desulfurase family protein [Candidatus Paceibacterota bacterium]